MLINSTVHITKQQEFQLEDLAKEFNKQYVLATHTSRSSDWFNAALAARRLVDHMETVELIDAKVYSNLVKTFSKLPVLNKPVVEL